MQEILFNVFIFCGILLLLAITVAVVQIVIILIDVRKLSNSIMDKINAVVSLFDIVGVLFSGLEGAKKRVGSKNASLVGVTAGIKKALQILFR